MSTKLEEKKAAPLVDDEDDNEEYDDFIERGMLCMLCLVASNHL
jgi:hypothetical protein